MVHLVKKNNLTKFSQNYHVDFLYANQCNSGTLHGLREYVKVLLNLWMILKHQTRWSQFSLVHCNENKTGKPKYFNECCGRMKDVSKHGLFYKIIHYCVIFVPHFTQI